MFEDTDVKTCLRISASSSGFKGSKKNFANETIDADTLSFGNPREVINVETEEAGVFICDAGKACDACGVFIIAELCVFFAFVSVFALFNAVLSGGLPVIAPEFLCICKS
jgi:hypothetical protein